MARVLLSCGETSGESYGAALVHHLRAHDPHLEVFGLGGDGMAAEGVTLVAHVRDLAVVGLTEVVRHFRRLRGIFNAVLAEVDRRPPDLAVLVDYPDFNLRLARKLHARGVPIVYYVSPQLWAWRPGRIKQIREHVARMLVIFPFEERLYREAGVPVTFVGHPLVEMVRAPGDRDAFLTGVGLDPGRPVIALLPGSRRQEVAHNLPPIAGAVEKLRAARPELQFLLAQAPALDDECYAAFEGLDVRRVSGDTQRVVSAAAVAVVASGTATVETALLGVPMVVVYRISPLSYRLGRPFVRVSRFAMVNLIAEREVVPELIQDGFTPERVAQETLSLLDDPARAHAMREGLAEVRRRLGEPGASVRAAQEVSRVLASGQKILTGSEVP